MKRVIVLGVALLALPVLVRLLMAQAPPPSQAPPPPPTYTLTDLGPMSLTAAPSGPTALNGNGQVTGFFFVSVPYGANRAFLWNKGTFTDLGTLGGAAGFGYGVNNAGQTAGTADLSSTAGFNTERAFLWQNGAMTNLGDPNPDPSYYSQAFAINSAGDVGGYEIETNGYQHPIIWKGGTHAGATVLPSLSCIYPVCQGRVLALNDVAQAAGWSVFGTGGQHPVIWSSSGQPTDLGSLGPAGYSSQANAININGAAVGYSTIDAYTVHAILWQNGVLQDLGAIPGANPYFTNLPPDNCSSAWGINSKGQIVGISGYGANTVVLGNGGRAFLYTDGTMYDLTSRLAPGTNWKLLKAAWAINDAGQIVGVGIDPTNAEHGYLLTPIITSTTTALSASVNPSVFGQQVSFTATVAPTASSPNIPSGTVTFKDGATVLGTVTPLTNGAATLSIATLGVSGHNITASYSGDNNFGSSTSVTLNQTVNQATTTTTLALSPNPSNFGQAVTFTATVTVVAPGAGSPTSIVTFLDGTTTLGTATLNGAATATFTTSSLASGSHSVTASYGGDTNFTGSTTSTTVTLTVSPPPATHFAVSAPAAATVGTAFNFTVTALDQFNNAAKGYTGTVHFTSTDALAVLPADYTFTAGDNGTHVFSATMKTAGNQTITGIDSANAAITGTSNTITVSPPPPPPPVPIFVNEAIHVTDTPSFPDVFEKITVSDQVTVKIIASPTTTSISAAGVTYGTAASATVSVSSPGGTVAGTVTLSVDGGAAYSVAFTGGSAIFNLGVLKAGSHSLAASFSAQGSFAASTGPGTLTVSPAALTVTASNAQRLYGQPNPTFSGTITGIQNGDNITATYATSATPASPAGTYAIVPTLADPNSKLGNYTVTLNNGTLTVGPAALTVTAASAQRLYGQANPTFNGTVTGIQNGDNITATYGTSATPASPVGTYSITPVVLDPSSRLSNYTVSLVNGTLTVVPETTSLSVTISPSSIVVGQSATVMVTLTALDMVIPIDPSVLAPITVNSPIVSDILTNNGTCAPTPGAAPGTATCTVTLTAVEPNGRTLLASFSGSSALAASTGKVDLVVTAPLESKVSCIKSDFRNVAVPGGSYLWFNSVFKIRDVNKQKVTITFFQSSVQFQYRDASNSLIIVNQPLPDAKITIDPSVTTASTTFDGINHLWLTTVPFDLDDNTFLTGIPWLVPAGGIPGDIEPVTWCGTFASDTAGVDMGWRWAAAAYSSFSGDNSTLGLKPMDTDHDNPPVNRDRAGTPENFKAFVIPGARGKGGKNYTGSYSGSAEIE